MDWLALGLGLMRVTPRLARHLISKARDTDATDDVDAMAAIGAHADPRAFTKVGLFLVRNELIDGAQSAAPCVFSSLFR